MTRSTFLDQELCELARWIRRRFPDLLISELLGGQVTQGAVWTLPIIFLSPALRCLLNVAQAQEPVGVQALVP
jgi:hypothetical protein